MARKVLKGNKPGEIRYRAVCINCGSFIPVNSGMARDGRNYCDACGAALLNAPMAPPPAPAQPPAPFFAPSGALKILSYVLSLSPVIGFLLGVIFFPQKDAALRKFGRNCFIMMGIGLVLGLLMFIIVVAAGAAFGSGVSGSNFGEGYY